PPEAPGPGSRSAGTRRRRRDDAGRPHDEGRRGRSRSMILSRRSLLAGSAALATTRGARASGAIDDLLARVAKARQPVRTLKGPFTQTRTIGLLSTDVRSVGSLTLVRPDRLRWELAPPDAVTFWIGPEG